MYTDDFLEKVKSFGILGYSAERMLHLVDPDDPEQFLRDFEDPASEVYKAYHKGKISGEYTLDKALFDASKNNDLYANETLYKRKNKEKIDDHIHKLFGV